MGGIGGAFFAAFHQNIYPATYTISDSVNFMLYCFLGGLSYIFGPVVGAFLLVIAFELLTCGSGLPGAHLWRPHDRVHALAAERYTESCSASRQQTGGWKEVTMAILDVQGITKRFGGLTAVNNVSFSVDKGRDPVRYRTEWRRQKYSVQVD